MFSELAEFFKLQGHCNVPNDWRANPELARWVYQQRVEQRQGRLTPHQVRRMEGIGFAWNAYDGDWDTMVERLVEHLRPMHSGRPRDRVMDAELRSWTVNQRQFKKRGELDAERERKLSSIGFEWSPYSKQWEQMVAMLRDFQSERGHCRVPTKWPKNPRLANWVAVQRARKSAGKLSAERIAALDALGFSWRIGSSGGRPFGAQTWDWMFAELKKYKETHGNCLVPQRSRQHPRLSDWVSAQRVSRNKGVLDSAREQKLADLGFDWNPIATRWDEMFAQLVEFKKRHGHTNVPQRTREFPQLGSWVRNQR